MKYPLEAVSLLFCYMAWLGVSQVGFNGENFEKYQQSCFNDLRRKGVDW
jgi:hypothetical protein